MTLTKRELMILELIVRKYTENGQPVGSKALVDTLPIHVSSATIRNDMVKLEEAGLIEKTHSSSGRVPSREGYRYYVDHLMRPVSADQSELATIKSSFDQSFRRIDDIVKISADMLSQMTNYTALSLKPNQVATTIDGFRLVPLGSSRVMLILATSNGEASTQQFSIPPELQGEELEKVVHLMNDRLVGKSLAQAYQLIHSDLPVILSKYLHNKLGVVDVFSDMISRNAEDQFFVGGKLNILNFSDPKNLESVRKVFGILNTQDALSDLLSNDEHGVNVRIGNEISDSVLQDYSLITASYDIGTYGQGLIAILGPTSMQYSKMLGIVDVFRAQLSSKMLEYYKNLDGS
ncbi:heat-inducible transcriptional repressor HrcA [Pediococcus claussenii]|nr:heat-inducible transcriptional repressor HrcA [Pediococcus claussenii]